MFRQRVCHFPPCGTVFYLCPHCDRGQQYCSPRCREKSRRLQRREANRRHQQTPDGRADHRDRQREYRQRLKTRVTDQSSLHSSPCANLTAPPARELVEALRHGSPAFAGYSIHDRLGRVSDLWMSGALGESFLEVKHDFR